MKFAPPDWRPLCQLCLSVPEDRKQKPLAVVPRLYRHRFLIQNNTLDNNRLTSSNPQTVPLMLGETCTITSRMAEGLTTFTQFENPAQ
jgi:hypothetical protein